MVSAGKPNPLSGTAGNDDLTTVAVADSHILAPASRANFLGDEIMPDKKVTPEMAAIIKLARMLKINYSVIASYFVINQGRIADVMKGRIFPEITPATQLPADFPTA
jgi:hypothetical protein